MTDVFLLPLGDGGREGLGREKLPRWVALIILLQEEVERKSFSYVPTDLSPRALRMIPEEWLAQAFSFPFGVTGMLTREPQWEHGSSCQLPQNTGGLGRPQMRVTLV